MIAKIWRVLAQILFYRNDLNETIKPFFENLKNENIFININDKKYIPLLKTFSIYQLKALYENGIISEEKFNLLIPKNQKENQSSTKEMNSTINDINTKIEEIISGDKIKELQELLQEILQQKKIQNTTMLHYAAIFNSKEILELLISKGADINANDIIYLNIKILFLIKII